MEKKLEKSLVFSRVIRKGLATFTKIISNGHKLVQKSLELIVRPWKTSFDKICFFTALIFL